MGCHLLKERRDVFRVYRSTETKIHHRFTLDFHVTYLLLFSSCDTRAFHLCNYTYIKPPSCRLDEATFAQNPFLYPYRSVPANKYSVKLALGGSGIPP